MGYYVAIFQENNIDLLKFVFIAECELLNNNLYTKDGDK
jgi:hypothetical protein